MNPRIILALVGILLLGVASASNESNGNDMLAPLVSPSRLIRVINDKYIVVMKPSSENHLLPILQSHRMVHQA